MSSLTPIMREYNTVYRALRAAYPGDPTTDQARNVLKHATLARMADNCRPYDLESRGILLTLMETSLD